MNAPRWWTQAHDLSWNKLKSSVVDEWHKAVAGAQKLEKSVAEQAMKFGHGASDAFEHAGKWTEELEAKLKSDWEKTHQDATVAWAKVRDAVKHGFEKSNKPK